jgi:tryptophan-rich sensory protein
MKQNGLFSQFLVLWPPQVGLCVTLLSAVAKVGLCSQCIGLDRYYSSLSHIVLVLYLAWSQWGTYLRRCCRSDRAQTSG